MKINLNKLLDEDIFQIEIAQDIELEDMQVGYKEVSFDGPVKLEAAVYKADDGYYLGGTVEFKYIDSCDRCLTDVKHEDKVSISGKIVMDMKGIDEYEEDVVIYYDGTELHLNEAVIAAILLSLPMKSLCSENCEGICHSCGANLNEESCSCQEEYVDPRLEKLKQLIK